ncbi:MAG TPA: DoxX family protein [Candidatus Acidoferrales bacterium]|nr:DoxX family protein [Candidatus Acidoferrales bacterium]
MTASSQPIMQTAGSPGSISMKSIWAGRIISGLITAFMIFDAVIHMMKPAPVVEAFAKLNFPLSFAVPLGIVELLCIVLYVVPSTSILGAILLTSYLGGAVAIQLPTGNPFFGEILFPVYIGVFLWGGIYLRDARLRSLIPFQR